MVGRFKSAPREVLQRKHITTRSNLLLWVAETTTDKYNYKIDWLNKFYIYCKKLHNSNKKIIIAGDFNIIQKEIDCYDPLAWQGDALYTYEVKSILRKILNIGFVDSYRAKNPNIREYSFWDYQNGAWQKDHGIRIDLLLLSSECMDILEETGIHKNLRTKNRPSDHVPVWAGRS